MTVVGYPGTDTEWAQWHARCVIRLRSTQETPDPAVRHLIGEAPRELPGVPGIWWVVESRVFVAAKPGDRLDHKGERIGGIEILDPVEGDGGLLLRHDDLALQVVRHDGRTSVRVYAPAD